MDAKQLNMMVDDVSVADDEICSALVQYFGAHDTSPAANDEHELLLEKISDKRPFVLTLLRQHYRDQHCACSGCGPSDNDSGCSGCC